MKTEKGQAWYIPHYRVYHPTKLKIRVLRPRRVCQGCAFARFGQHINSDVAETIRRNLYVDHCLNAVPTEAEAI